MTNRHSNQEIDLKGDTYRSSNTNLMFDSFHSESSDISSLKDQLGIKPSVKLQSKTTDVRKMASPSRQKLSQKTVSTRLKLMDSTEVEISEICKLPIKRRNYGRNLSGTFHCNEESFNKIRQTIGFKRETVKLKRTNSLIDIKKGLKDTILPMMPPELTDMINDYLRKMNKTIPVRDGGSSKSIESVTVPKKDDRRLEQFNNVYDSISDDDDFVINDDSYHSRFIIDPNSYFNAYWSLLMFFAVMYSVIITPLIVAFSLEDPKLIILDIVIDFLFLTDTCLNFFLPFHGENNKYVYNHFEIVVHYLVTWFVFDLITSLPYGLLVESADIGGYRNVGKILRFTRLLRLTKWLKVVRLIKLLQETKFTEVFMSLEVVSRLQLNRVFKFTLLLLIGVHISSCLWVFVGKVYDDRTWILQNGLTDADGTTIYISSLYFILVTILSIGYGDITSTNLTERCVNLMFMLFGIMFFSYALSALGGIFSRMDEKSIRLEHKLNILSEIVKDYNIPSELRNKITNTVKHEVRKTGYGKYELIESLPIHLKTEMITTIHRVYMKNLFFFKGQSLGFVQFVLPMLRAIPFAKTEILFSDGNTLDEMYLIIKGALSLTLGQYYGNFEVGMLPYNSHFGDILLHMNYTSPYNLVARTKYCEVLVLKKKDFMRLRRTHYSNLLSILNQSVNIFELYERRRLLITEIHKYETNHKTIQNLMKTLNAYLLHQDDEIAQSMNFDELNTFFEKIGNSEFKTKFSEIAKKLENDFKMDQLSNSENGIILAERKPEVPRDSLEMARRRMSIDLFLGSIPVQRKSSNDLTKHSNPYKSLIERILSINHVKSGIDEKHAKITPQTLSNRDSFFKGCLDLDPIRQEILEEANKKPEEQKDEFKEVRKSLLRLSTLERKKKQKPSRAPRRSFRSGKNTPHIRRKSRNVTIRFAKLPENDNKPAARKSGGNNNRLPALKQSRINFSKTNLKKIIEEGGDGNIKVRRDSKAININVYNYGTNYNKNVFVLGDGKNTEGEIVFNQVNNKDSSMTMKSVENRNKMNAVAMGQAARFLGAEERSPADELFDSMCEKLDGIYYVLNLRLRMGEKLNFK
jgi:CRP-like cAMP-binding protein